MVNAMNRIGFASSILTALSAGIAFVIAIFTPPLSWPFCMQSCFSYPYFEIADRFPRDYLWMYPAMALMLVFVVFVASIHHYVAKERQIFSHLWILFALVSTTVLLSDFFIQVSVIQPSLIRWETQSISILTQYNPHGIFIVLEELGYIIMSISFLFIWLAMGKTRIEAWLRRVLFFGFLLTMISFVVISVMYWMNREYVFEVISILINWVVLIVSGILAAVMFSGDRQKEALP